MTEGKTDRISLVIQLFGLFDVQINGEQMPHLRSRKGLWLLALLILRRGIAIERSWLAGTLWPESTEVQALANLRLSLLDLRRALGSEAARISAPTSKKLALDLSGAIADVSLFDTYVASTDAALWEKAAALYRGPLLEGCEEDWVIQEREVREKAYIDSLERMATIALSQDDPMRAVSYLRRATLVDPLRESAQRKLMEALSAQGHIAEVTQVYLQLRLNLRESLRFDPEPETVVLYARVKSAAPPSSGSAASATKMFTPATTGSPLPNPLTPLIGRENQIAEVVDRFVHSRMVSLVGVGGVGKTRLSIAVARALAKDCPDGVWFVELASLENADLVPAAVAQTLQVRDEPGKTIGGTLATALASRSLLVVLDNCEHVLDACAHLAQELLMHCPRLRVLATSRQPFGINGEWIYRVPPLEYPRVDLVLTYSEVNKESIHQLLDYYALRLFVERVDAQKKRFKPTADQVLAIAEICALLDGIPLAIEMAAARARILPIEEIRASLADRFLSLSGGSRTALPRHQTLRALIDWSYDLLSIHEKLLLARLSVFAGGWTLAAAEVVCATASDCTTENERDNSTLFAAEVLHVLRSLVDKSLVVFDVSVGNAGARYSLLETVKQYAGEKLQASGERYRLSVQHQAYCLALAQEAAQHLQGSEQAHWLAVLDQEHDNLRAAMEMDGDVNASLRLGTALQVFWEMRGHLSEGRERLAAVLALPAAQERTRVRADALNVAGGLAHMHGDYAAARFLHEESLTIVRECGDKGSIAASLHRVAGVARDQCDFDAANSLYVESLTISRALEDIQGVAYSLHSLGNVASDQGDYALARSRFEESLRVCRELGHKDGIAYSLDALASLSGKQLDLASSHALYLESLRLRRDLGDTQGIAWTLVRIGGVTADQGDYDAARSLIMESMTTFQELGHKQAVAFSLEALASVAAAEGENVQARSLFQESMARYRDLGHNQGVAYSLLCLGHLAYDQHNYTEAHSLYVESQTVFRQLKDRQGHAHSLHGLTKVALAEGDYTTALDLIEETLTMQQEINNELGAVVALEGFAALCVRRGNADCATQLWGAIEKLREHLGAPQSPDERLQSQRDVTAARLAMDQAAFAAAWDRGREMSLEQAVEFALNRIDLRP